MGIPEIIIVSIIALAIWVVILTNIISNAVKAKSLESHLKMQTALLVKIAEKQGVSLSDLDKIVNGKNLTSDEKLIAGANK